MNWVQMTRKNYFDDDDDASTDPCYYQKYKILATKKTSFGEQFLQERCQTCILLDPLFSSL